MLPTNIPGLSVAALTIQSALCARSDAAQAMVTRISQAVAGLCDGIDFDSENGIPLIELWLEADDAVMSARRVALLGKAISDVCGRAPVHMYQLDGKGVRLFVYANVFLRPGDDFSDASFNEYGMPLDTWLNGVLAGDVS